MRPDAIDFLVDALDFDVEAGEGVEAGFEHFEIVDHRLRPLGQSFARNDGGDAGGIDHERRRGNAAGDGVDRQIVDVVAHEIARGVARRHRDVGQMLGEELLRLQRADAGVAEEAVHVAAEIA